MSLELHEFHAALGGRFGELAGAEIVADYGEVLSEYQALRSGVGVMDLSFRGRVCLLGADRVRFLQGRVPSDVERLRLWMETTAGTELDATAALRPLERETWNERRRRLEQLGGAPPGVEE